MSYLHISFLFTFMSIVSEAVLRDGLRIESHKSGFSVSILTPCTMLCLVAQSCQTLGPHGLWPTRSLCPWDSSGENTGVSCYALLQGIFPTQGSNPGLPHCGWILYQLGHKGSPRNTGVGGLSLLQRIFLIQELNLGPLHCRWIL